MMASNSIGVKRLPPARSGPGSPGQAKGVDCFVELSKLTAASAVPHLNRPLLFLLRRLAPVASASPSRAHGISDGLIDPIPFTLHAARHRCRRDTIRLAQ